MNLGYIMYRAPQRPASTYAFGLDGKRTNSVSYTRRIVLFLLQMKMFSPLTLLVILAAYTATSFGRNPPNDGKRDGRSRKRSGGGVCLFVRVYSWWTLSRETMLLLCVPPSVDRCRSLSHTRISNKIV